MFGFMKLADADTVGVLGLGSQKRKDLFHDGSNLLLVDFHQDISDDQTSP
jgi:hypothetical protein